MEKTLPKSYGVKFDYEVKTDTRGFDQVDAAAVKAGIKHEHMPEKPTTGQAISRAIACLMRICMSSIAFPVWSKYHSWEETRDQYRVINGVQTKTGQSVKVCTGRNPNYSLKITQVKQAKVDSSTTWRINIANRNKAGENMGHVLSVTYDTTKGVYFTQGTDPLAYAAFGREVQAIVGDEYKRFANNYNDEDIRKVLDAELEDMKALKVIKNTNRFIAHEYMDRAKALYTFAEECGQVVSWLGLDNSPMTRDSLLRDLKASVEAEMDEYEATLDEKLNPKGLERKRGEKRREQMYDTAMGNIDRIMAMAEYHADILGAMAEGIVAKRDRLRAKASKLLTLTGEEVVEMPAAKEAQPAPGPQVVAPEDAFA